MKIYIIDPDGIVRRELGCMIEKGGLGEVAGMSSGWDDACGRIPETRPDIILADLPLRGLNGMACVRTIKEKIPAVSIVMLSRFHDTQTVNRAYGCGADFLLHKPVNVAEISSILRVMEMAGMMESLFRQAQSGLAGMRARSAEERGEPDGEGAKSLNLSIRHLKGILRDIGILNEAGSKDVIRMISYLIEHGIEFGDITIRELCGRMEQNAKSVEQRIRRAASEGMYNLASRGMDDCADPVFNEYAGRLYSFEQMKKEMNYIRGKSESHGGVRVRDFIGGLFDCCRNM